MATPNLKDARFRRCDQQIHSAFHIFIKERRTNVHLAEICQAAGVSRATFYEHYHNGNFIAQYEQKLKAKFLARLPQMKLRKEIIFTILLSFVLEERAYFEATMPNVDFWLLKSCFNALYPALKTKECDQKSYEYYSMQQMILICYWVKHEKCAATRIAFYVRKMARLPIMKLEL